MKTVYKILPLILLLIFFYSANSQVSDSSSAVTDENIFEKVEEEATFPGGREAWINFLQNNLDPEVPVRFGAPEGHYTVVVQFIVGKDGKISDIKPLTRHGFGMENEVVRILKKSPNWNPAVHLGRVVRAYQKQPVTFAIIVEKKGKRKKKD